MEMEFFPSPQSVRGCKGRLITAPHAVRDMNGLYNCMWLCTQLLKTVHACRALAWLARPLSFGVHGSGAYELLNT